MLSFFKSSKSTKINDDDIIKEGWLSKESKFRKVWRERWCVLTHDSLTTYEKERFYDSPTEFIEVTKVKTIKSDDKSSSTFKVETTDGIFQFQAKSFDEKEAWIGAIGKAMVKTSNSAIFIPEEDQ